MSDLKGTKTEQNLRDAFAGESQARNKYTFFASAAKKEGYEKIAAIFLETADNEKEHAKLHLKLLGEIGPLWIICAPQLTVNWTKTPRCIREWHEKRGRRDSLKQPSFSSPSDGSRRLTRSAI